MYTIAHNLGWLRTKLEASLPFELSLVYLIDRVAVFGDSQSTYIQVSLLLSNVPSYCRASKVKSWS